MIKILKRLELIKTAISIEDEEIIALQVMKLNAMDVDDEVEGILYALADKEYASVVVTIEAYLQKFSGLVVYEDKELHGLRLELKVLEKQLEALSSKKNEYLNEINEFNLQYHLHLGSIIQKILHIKEKILYADMQEKKDAFEEIKQEYTTLKEEYQELKSQKERKEKELEEMDEFDDEYDELYEAFQKLKEEVSEKEEALNQKRKETKKAKEAFEEDEATQAYEEVKQDHEEFSKEYEAIQKEERLEITEEERKELKKLFRKASWLCHPDIVADGLKEQAHTLMAELNEAYAKRDIKRVKEILIALESGKGFDVASDTIEDKALLKSKIVEIRSMIHENEIEIEAIEEDEVMQILNQYDDIEAYFTTFKEDLEAEYESLKNAYEQKVKQAPPTNNNIEEESYWNDLF